LFQLVFIVHHQDDLCAYVVHVPVGVAYSSTGDDKYIERDQGQKVKGGSLLKRLSRYIGTIASCGVNFAKKRNLQYTKLRR
jgi:hypothetical protein